jgi:hypothetical protein
MRARDMTYAHVCDWQWELLREDLRRCFAAIPPCFSTVKLMRSRARSDVAVPRDVQLRSRVIGFGSDGASSGNADGKN